MHPSLTYTITLVTWTCGNATHRLPLVVPHYTEYTLLLLAVGDCSFRRHHWIAVYRKRITECAVYISLSQPLCHRIGLSTATLHVPYVPLVCVFSQTNTYTVGQTSVKAITVCVFSQTAPILLDRLHPWCWTD